MIDLHTHTILSDGLLVPSELVRYGVVRGYRALALTDHGDHSNLDFIVPRIVEAAAVLEEAHGIPVLPGIELTFVPPGRIGEMAMKARALGAQIVLVHGETIVEPVMPGTNLAALKAAVDILAHPGLLSLEEAGMAAERGICLELTTRRGHSLTNGHVARMALKVDAALVLNNDAHLPDDLVTRDQALKIAAGAGLDQDDILKMLRNSEILVERITGKR